MSTVSSDGKIHVYDLAAVPPDVGKEVKEISPVAVYDSNGTRLTCVTLADGDADADIATGDVNVKRKRNEEIVVDGSENEGSEDDKADRDEEVGKKDDDSVEADEVEVEDESR